MINLLELQKKIDQICKDLSLRRLDLIGSATRGNFDERSDVDDLVSIAGDEYLFDRYFELKRVSRNFLTEKQMLLRKGR